MPDFFVKKDFDWAVETAEKKKGLDCSLTEFFTLDEGICVQIMHHEIYLSDPRKTSIEKMRTVIRHPIKLV